MRYDKSSAIVLASCFFLAGVANAALKTPGVLLCSDKDSPDGVVVNLISPHVLTLQGGGAEIEYFRVTARSARVIKAQGVFDGYPEGGGTVATSLTIGLKRELTLARDSSNHWSLNQTTPARNLKLTCKSQK